MLPEPIAVTLLVIDVLEQLGVDYVLGGPLASARYGVARATLDSDLVADLRPQHARPFVHQLQDTFYVNEQAVNNAIAHHASFNLIHLETVFKVDVFIPKSRPFDRNQIARGILQPVAPNQARTIRVASAEDTILAKLEWYRLGGEISERQWRDVLGIIAVQGDTLDLDYLWQEALTLSIADLLEKAFDH